MRIVGTIEHPVFKISIFSWNEKYIVKLEAGLFEQSYKFRESDFASWEDLKAFFNEAMLADVHNTFKKMSEDAQRAAKIYSTRGGIA